MIVYMLLHERLLSDGAEDIKIIGIYSSQSQAQQAITRMAKKPGFITSPEGFHIDEYEIDKDYWPDGYTTEFY